MMTEGKPMQDAITPELSEETVERAPLPKVIKGRRIRTETRRTDSRVTLRCNECGRKRKISPDGNYNDRCPNCGGVDWDVL